MPDTITGLKPQALWKRFADICSIPHCSKHEEKMCQYLIDAAGKKNLDARQDSAGNVVISVPATPGHEQSPGVVLQAHIDMVCEKNADKTLDFSKDGITPVIDGQWVGADGTSLGSDNGIGAAAALAVIDTDSCVHGPLELLFTVDEETGLNGANALEPGFVQGRILLNLDSEDEGVFFVGCAGGNYLTVSLPLARETVPAGETFSVTVSGLRGGHSGLDIDKGRGNANQILARLLSAVSADVKLYALQGGTKNNAISRESRAIISAPQAESGSVRKQLEQAFAESAGEYSAVEKDMKLSIEACTTDLMPLQREAKDTLLNLVTGLPHGVYAMSPDIEGLVETSDNVAIVQTEESSAEIRISVRSSVAAALETLKSKIEAVAHLAGADVQKTGGYPPWQPNMQSKLLGAMQKIHENVTGKKAEITAIHAGLECGIIGSKYQGMDMISFGPEIENPHSPDERVHIESVARFWDLLKAGLEELCAYKA